MEGAPFIFKITPYDSEKLLSQVAGALKTRTELISREKYPRLWGKTDTLKNARSENTPKNSFIKKAMSIFCLAAGIFLIIPGITEPKTLFVPLAAGIFSSAVGAFVLMVNISKSHNPFKKGAAMLLSGLENPKPVTLSFGESGMALPSESGEKRVNYDSFERVIEGPDIFLVVYDGKIAVLQKNDLAAPLSEFKEFISKKTCFHESL